MKVAVGTRFWGVSIEKDFPRIVAFVEAAKKIGSVFVAVNTIEDKIGTLEAFPDVAFPVTPWGKFVQPLNAIVLKAAAAGADFLLLASAEFPPTLVQLDFLFAHMGPATLVVGAAFAEHQFHADEEVSGTGVTVPWNTFSVWNLKNLRGVGFPLIGDAPLEPKMAGVEEVCTIALLQRLNPMLKAKLVKVPGLGEKWDMSGWDESRLAQHRAKIRSKIERPAWQLGEMNLNPPKILHIA
jgi:hypothetical protein